MKAEFSIGGPSLPVISRAPSNTVTPVVPGPWLNRVVESATRQQAAANMRITQSISAGYSGIHGSFEHVICQALVHHSKPVYTSQRPIAKGISMRRLLRLL